MAFWGPVMESGCAFIRSILLDFASMIMPRKWRQVKRAATMCLITGSHMKLFESGFRDGANDFSKDGERAL